MMLSSLLHSLFIPWQNLNQPRLIINICACICVMSGWTHNRATFSTVLWIWQEDKVFPTSQLDSEPGQCLGFWVQSQVSPQRDLRGPREGTCYWLFWQHCFSDFSWWRCAEKRIKASWDRQSITVCLKQKWGKKANKRFSWINHLCGRWSLADVTKWICFRKLEVY